MKEPTPGHRATGLIPPHAMNISKIFTYISPIVLVLLIALLAYTGHTTSAFIAGALAIVATALYLAAYVIRRRKR